MKRNRQIFFDFHRNLRDNINSDMANQAELEAFRQSLQQLQQQLVAPAEIEALRQSLQQTQQQYQVEMETLRQRIAAQPSCLFQLTTDQVLKKFQNIKTFYGRDDYPLQEFINAVENVASLCNNNQQLLQHGLSMVFKEKLQGDARRCIQRLGNRSLTWETVKTELKTHFRPRKSYKKLLDESRSIKVNSLRELFSVIKSINCQLNELYEFDSNKPSNYSPENNDKNLVDIIKDMITGSYRNNISRNMSLIEVFNIFEDLELLDENEVIHYKYRKNNFNSEVKYNSATRRQIKRGNQESRENNFNRKSSVEVRQNSNSGQYRNFNNNSNSRQFRRNEHSGQYRNNNNNSNSDFNSGHYRNAVNNNNNRFNSGQFRGRPNSNSNCPEPMEIGNLQQEDVNFTNEPRTVNYQ